MTRYAKRPRSRAGARGKRTGWLRAGISGAAAAAGRNPVAVGGTTAFLVSLAFVSANALFYQPQVHPSAFLSTRILGPRALPDLTQHPHPQSAPREIRQIEPAGSAVETSPDSTGSVPPPAGGDGTVRSVQTVLNDLGLYAGPIDGMTGPQTNAAVETYRRIVGLEPGSQIDGALLHQLGLRDDGQAAQEASTAPQTASAEPGDSNISKVQAGLKAFGNDGIEIDGMMGERTREAIREFQSLFGLPVTGEPDAPLVAKMREIGLIN
ncbi:MULTISPECIES: peptidoglycan-binding domain-containing protein [Chelativorans]|nr:MULTISPECIES: peptidoglycan-binding protein [Chelativorans]